MGAYAAPRYSSLEDRFRALHRVREDGCWEWLGTRRRLGYGVIRVDGRLRPAHRLSWELCYKRPAPKGLFACHTCDNPWCVNPKHIFLGTPGDNTRDAALKGRMRTTLDLPRIAELLRTGRSRRDVAREVGCSGQAINKAIRSGRLVV